MKDMNADSFSQILGFSEFEETNGAYLRSNMLILHLLQLDFGHISIQMRNIFLSRLIGEE